MDSKNFDNVSSLPIATILVLRSSTIRQMNLSNLTEGILAIGHLGSHILIAIKRVELRGQSRHYDASYLIELHESLFVTPDCPFRRRVYYFLKVGV